MNLDRIFSIDDPSLQGRKDAELVSLIADGNHDAFAFVMKNYYRFIYSRFGRYGWNNADIEELTQDVFLNLYNSAPKLRETNPTWTLGSMLATFASRAADLRQRLHRRAKRTGITISADSPQEDGRGKQKPAYTFRDHRPLQDYCVTVNEILSLMPPADRELIERYVMEDCAARELGEAMNCSPATIQNRATSILKSTKRRMMNRKPPQTWREIISSQSREQIDAQLAKIIQMREQGKKFREIAEHLGISLGTCCSSFHNFIHGSQKTKKTINPRSTAKRAYAVCVAVDQAIGDAVNAIIGVSKFVPVPVLNPPPPKPRRPREIREEETRKIMEMQQTGMTYPAIATALGLSLKTVSHRFQRNAPKSMHPGEKNKEVTRKVIEMRNQGMTFSAIAAELGITINSAIKRNTNESKKAKDRIYAACVLTDAAMGKTASVIAALKKPSASVGMDVNPKRGEV